MKFVTETGHLILDQSSTTSEEGVSTRGNVVRPAERENAPGALDVERERASG
jgi:hypothetical protein